MSTILMGFQGVGKTFFGSKIAQEVGMHFIDSDHLIEKLYQEQWKDKKRVSEIYQSYGELFFRKLEKEVILTTNLAFPQIFALGGGSLTCSQEVRLYLKKAKNRVFLHREKVDLKKMKEQRPFCLQEMDIDTFYKQRLALFLENYDYLINVDQHSKERVMKILKQLVI